MASRKWHCYRQWAGKAGATDQQSQEKQDVEDLITTPTRWEGHEEEVRDDRAPESASTIHNYSDLWQAPSQFDHKHSLFFRLHRRHCPNSIGKLINGKSCPNLTTNIHNSSGYTGGAAQSPLANTINDRSHPTIHQIMLEVLPKFIRQMITVTSLIPIWPWTSTILSLVQIRPWISTILQDTLEALPKFHMWTQMMTSLIQILPQIQLANAINDGYHSTILLVTPEALPKFHRQPN